MSQSTRKNKSGEKRRFNNTDWEASKTLVKDWVRGQKSTTGSRQRIEWGVHKHVDDIVDWLPSLLEGKARLWSDGISSQGGPRGDMKRDTFPAMRQGFSSEAAASGT